MQLVFIIQMYRDARSTEHKTSLYCLHPPPGGWPLTDILDEHF